DVKHKIIAPLEILKDQLNKPVVSGQTTVIQKHQFLSVKEGDSTLLNCSYQGMEYNLQWYKQYPGGQPEFMVFHISPGAEVKDHFEMSLDTNNKTTFFHLKNTQLKDSALYFSAGWSTVIRRHLLAVMKGAGEAIELPSWWPSE
uniref:Ig-like domain-containing protein n=1 Tax=Laticauda laticaudata TaxID=8630 RepID=A0A8C5RAA4_LATLA